MIKRLALLNRHPLLLVYNKFSSSKHNSKQQSATTNIVTHKKAAVTALQLPSRLKDKTHKISHLFSKLQSFRAQLPIYLKLALSQSSRNSSINLIAHLCRVCLIAESLSYIKNQQYYGAIKKSIRNLIANIPSSQSSSSSSKMQQSSSSTLSKIPNIPSSPSNININIPSNINISPYSCTLFLQFLSISKWQGDQYTIIDKLCSYYENNIYKFTIKQQTLFWNSYVSIMANKVHDVGRFRKMERLAGKVIEYCDIKDTIQCYYDTSSINRNIIKQLKYQSHNQLTIKLQLNNRVPQIILRIKQMPDLNQYLHHQSDLQDNQNQLQMRRVLTNQTRQLNSHVRKGWQLVMMLDHKESSVNVQNMENNEKYSNKEKYNNNKHNNNNNNKDKEKYMYKVKKIGDLEYVGTQKVQPQPIVDKSNLNNKQSIQSLRTSANYISAIYYTIPPTPSSYTIIHTALTLLLSIPSSLLSSPAFSLFVLSPYTSSSSYSYLSLSHLHSNSHSHSHSHSHICQYITMPQLYQLLPLSALHQNLTQILNTFSQTHSTLSYIFTQQKIQQYNLQQISNQIQSNKMNKQQTIKYLAKFNQIWTDITITNTNKLNINRVNIDQEVYQEYLKFMPGIVNYQYDAMWQCVPFFNQTISIMQYIQQLRIKAKENQQKNVKVKILCNKRIIPYLVKHILDAKYMTVPKIKQTNEQGAHKKQQIISQLFTKAKRQQ